jgi:hypothetical protein
MARKKQIIEEVCTAPEEVKIEVKDPIKTLQEQIDKLTLIMTRIEQRLDRFGGGY